MAESLYRREYIVGFTITEDHLKLLRRAYVSWDAREFGAPAIDCKRPYGNSDVYGDIADILGIKRGDDDYKPFTNQQQMRMLAIHEDTKRVLQIVLITGEMKAGTYEAESYMNNWRRVE